jgi:hypothetical protein
MVLKAMRHENIFGLFTKMIKTIIGKRYSHAVSFWVPFLNGKNKKGRYRPILPEDEPGRTISTLLVLSLPDCRIKWK